MARRAHTLVVVAALAACEGPPPDATPDAAPLADAAEPACTDCARPACVDDVARELAELPTEIDPARYLTASNPDVIPWPRYTQEPSNQLGLLEHIQGIQRLGRHVILSGSGKHATPPTSHLAVIEMGGRSADGPWSLPSFAPAATDRVVAFVALDPVYWHAGGIQLESNLLAVPLYGDAPDRGDVRFYDLADPSAPQELVGARIVRTGKRANAVALTREPDGRYLALVWDDTTLDFYRSRTDRVADGFVAPHVVIPADVTGGFQGGGCGLSGCGTYQQLTFVRQCDGALFVLGARNSQKNAPAVPGKNLASLYRVDADLNVAFVARRELGCRDAQCNFAAGAGVYVQDATHLVLYGASHWLRDGGREYRFNEYAAP